MSKMTPGGTLATLGCFKKCFNFETKKLICSGCTGSGKFCSDLIALIKKSS